MLGDPADHFSPELHDEVAPAGRLGSKGVLDIRGDDPECASKRRRLERARKELALALQLDGQPDEGVAVLEQYLEANPDGEWAEVTRSALERLR